MNRAELNKKFEKEVAELLISYINNDKDTAEYVALKIAKLHDTYVEMELSANGE
nr:hypothetical protein [uncultured Mediterraneibacter sp.]